MNKFFQKSISRRYITSKNNPDINTKAIPGILFDIDGVLSRGGTILPAAREAFRKLYCPINERFKLPIVFVTNAGNLLRSTKAESLSASLGYKIDKSQVIMSHTPLKNLTSRHNKYSLISGQGPIIEIAEQLGFKHTITVDQLREKFKYLDMIDQLQRPTNVKVYDNTLNERIIPKIEQIILFGEPNLWERNLQLITDCIVSDGDFWQTGTQQDYELFGVLGNSDTHIPIIAANMDLQWQAEAPGPRFGHGMFLTCLEAAYSKLTGGKQLSYTATAGKPGLLTYQHAEFTLSRMVDADKELGRIYCIGDNLISDIYGANRYNHNTCRNFLSMLVCTGVYHPVSKNDLSALRSSIKSINIHHAPTDFHAHIHESKELLQPTYLFDDVNDCVSFVLEKEGV